MIKKVFTMLLGLLVAGAMISVDCSDAAVKRNRVRPRTVSKPVTQPAPTATQQTTAAPAAAATATAPKTTTTAPAATATQPATAQGMPYGQTAATGQSMAAPQSQGSGMGSTLLGVGAGLAGGYLLNSALSGSDATAAVASAEGGQSAAAAAPAPAAAPASPVANLLGYDTANYCTQLSQGNADVMQQCTAAEAAATAAFRQCVAMSSGLNGIGSYDVLLRCLRGTPAAQ